MPLTWLHVSDFHFKGGDAYDRDVVLRALVQSVERYRKAGRRPDLIFATGDVANFGKPEEYAAATPFFDALLAAASVDKRRLFVIPGNHDVDRDLGVGLARTLSSREEADRYFGPKVPKTHLVQKQGAFRAWHDAYFAGIQTLPDATTCGRAELVEIGGERLAVLPLNSALFCQDDADHSKLWIGRRCLDAAIAELDGLNATLKVALIHHPLDWLHEAEASQIRTGLQDHVDLVLRGHLHKSDVEVKAGVMGQALHLAAGAAYQTRQWPNRALYCSFVDGRVTVFPIRYEDEPREVWTTDPSVFPHDPGHTGSFAVPRLTPADPGRPPAAPPPQPPPKAALFRCNIPSRRNLPFVGREDLLGRIVAAFADRTREAFVVLRGAPGVGKSELAREFARRHEAAYPCGRFIVGAGRQALAVDLARIGTTLLDVDMPPDLNLADQGLRTLASLGTAPTLLVYDNVPSVEAVADWLPFAGMPCHVLLTSNLERWPAGWLDLEVLPLSQPDALRLIEGIAGREVRASHGDRLADLAHGLPVQLVPASATLAHEARRGRLAAASLTLTEQAGASFSGVYRQLEPDARLLLHAAVQMNPQRIPKDELARQLADAAAWSARAFQRALDAILDLHLLEDGDELRMHQLFAAFLTATPVDAALAESLAAIRRVQARRLIAIAREFAAAPNRADLAAALLAFPITLGRWDAEAAGISVADGEWLGKALVEIGQWDVARPWYERAVAVKEEGDVRGRVDHASLGKCLHEVGYCLSQTGDYAGARPWYERAVTEMEQGDVHGRVDHDSLGRSLHQVGYCLSQTGDHTGARPWYERAVAEKEQGDVHGRVDHASLRTSLESLAVILRRLGQEAEAEAVEARARAVGEGG